MNWTKPSHGCLLRPRPREHDHPIKKRPLAITLALIYFALETGEKLVLRIIYTPWSNLSADIPYWASLVLNILVLWFVFRGKNWARWFLSIWTVFAITGSMVVSLDFHQTHSLLWTIWFWLNDLLDLLAVVALFHSASSRWFRQPKFPVSPSEPPSNMP